MMRARRGFTLWELTIVLALVALGTALVIPNWVNLDDPPAPVPGETLLALLRDARRFAIEQRQTVAVRIDPTTRYYRIDTTGVNGTGALLEGEIQLGAYETLETDRPRLQYIFQPTGAALGDTVVVRGSEGQVMIALDAWSGTTVAYAR